MRRWPLRAWAFENRWPSSGTRLSTKSKDRQGNPLCQLPTFINELAKLPALEIEGAYTHFANIEDTLDPFFAESQVHKFREALRISGSKGVVHGCRNCRDPTAITVATRIPAKITPKASGISTFHKSCASVIPIARPASRIAGSTPEIPVNVL